MIEIDVVGARRSGFESYGLADHKGDCLCFRLSALPWLSSFCVRPCATSRVRVHGQGC